MIRVSLDSRVTPSRKPRASGDDPVYPNPLAYAEM